MLTCLVSVLFTFYIQDVLKLKKNNNSGAKGLRTAYIFHCPQWPGQPQETLKTSGSAQNTYVQLTVPVQRLETDHLGRKSGDVSLCWQTPDGIDTSPSFQ